MQHDAFEQHASHKAQYSIGHDAKYREERRAALHVEQVREQRMTWNDRVLTAAGLLVFVVMALGMCACVAGMAGGYIRIF